MGRKEPQIKPNGMLKHFPLSQSPPMATSRANGNQQPMFDVSEAIKKQCECGSVHFDKAFEVRLVSKLAPNNKTRQDIIIEVPVYICHGCCKALIVMIE